MTDLTGQQEITSPVTPVRATQGPRVFNIEDLEANPSTPPFTPFGTLRASASTPISRQRRPPSTNSLLARSRISTARSRVSPTQGRPATITLRNTPTTATTAAKQGWPVVNTAPFIHSAQPHPGPSTNLPTEHASRGTKRKATEEGLLLRWEKIDKGLAERSQLRMNNIQRGLDERKEAEAEAEARRKAKGKHVDRGLASGFSYPTHNPQLDTPSSFPTPHLDDATLLALDKADREAMAPPSKRPRTNLQLGGEGPALFTTNFGTKGGQRANVANSFPKQQADRQNVNRRPVNSHFERLAMLQNNHGNVTGDPRMHLTPPPVGGSFPYVEGSGPLWLQENVPDWVLRDWEELIANKMFLQVYGMSAHPSNPRHDAVLDQLPTLLNDIFNTTGITLSRPVLEHGYHLEANTFLLWGMNNDILDALLTYRVFSTPQYQFFCYPYEPSFPEFLCTLERFNPSFLAKPEAEASILALIKRTLIEKPWIDTITNIVEDENTYVLDPDQKSTALEVIDSIWIKIQIERAGGNIAKPIVNVYSPSPSSRPVLWSAWKSIFHTAKFKSGTAGTGEYVKTRYCKGCHAVDHSRGLCPFPNIPGWHDDAPPPPHQNTDNNQRPELNNNNNSNGDRRGGWSSGRGRGRGRGNGNRGARN